MNHESDPMVDALRASLARHAADAPAGDRLAEQIIGAAEHAPAPKRPHRRTGWRTWALPLVAAGAVGAVVTAVATIENYHPSADKAPPAQSHRPTASPTASTTAGPTSALPASPSPAVGADLHHVRILDLTFGGTDLGWALASADCVHGSGRCTALLRTTDGRTWRSMPGAAFNVDGVKGCADPCVSHLRFANDQIGYAYGPSALFMTSDGGASWKRQPGLGADALETLDGNVVRVYSSPSSGCPGPCHIRAATAAIGGDQWRSTALSSGGAAVGLSRGGHNAYVLVMRNPAGGAPDQTSTLYRSTDDGRTWTAAGEPCPRVAGEVDSRAVAGGGGDRVSVLCTVRQAPRRSFVATSTDAGRNFTARPGTVPSVTAAQLTGDADTVLMTADQGLARSTDGGATWLAVARVSGQVTFVGFESPTVGRAVTDSGRTIWTTRDGGRTWHSVTLP